MELLVKDKVKLPSFVVGTLASVSAAIIECRPPAGLKPSESCKSIRIESVVLMK